MTDPNLDPIAEDGRCGLFHSGKKYSLISIDAYRPPYIPLHLTTSEFFQEVHDHLDPQGALVLNVGRVPDDEQLLAGLAATIGSVFPSVHIMDVPGTYNSIIYATKQETTWSNLEQNLDLLLADPNTEPILIEAIQTALNHQRQVPEGGQVFTDDRAPIEWITNRMVLNSILSDPEFGVVE